MQLGFAFLEAGNIEVKHVTNILMKVVMNSLLAAFGWWACGFAFSYGEREGHVINSSVHAQFSGQWFYWHCPLLQYGDAQRSGRECRVIRSVVLYLGILCSLCDSRVW
jgi:hypothetical protein